MKIEILGTGCPKCKQLEANAKKALEETGKKADVVKITEIDKIIEVCCSFEQLIIHIFRLTLY